MNKTIENKIREIISENISTNFDFKNIPIEQDLTDVGFNSIDFIKVAIGIEVAFEFEWDDDDLDFDDFNNIGKIVDFVSKKISD